MVSVTKDAPCSRRRGGREVIEGEHDGALKVRVKAPAVDGRANEALIKFLADKLGISRSAVEIVAGRTSRRKVIRVKGLSTAETEARLYPGRP